MDCPECGSPLPSGTEVCPHCTAAEETARVDQTPRILAGLGGLVLGVVLALLLLPAAGEVVFFYAVWILPSVLCILGYTAGKHAVSGSGPKA